MVEGKIVNMDSKKTKTGNWLWRLEVDDGQNKVWYSAFEIPQGLNTGDRISFLPLKKGEYLNATQIVVLPKAAASETSLPFVSKKDSYWEDKAAFDIQRDERIKWAGLLNTAVELVKMCTPKDVHHANVEKLREMVFEQAERLNDFLKRKEVKQ